MATDDDLTFGHHISDETLRDVCDRAEYSDGDAFSMITAILLLDQALGLTQEGDRLVMQPSLAGWVVPFTRVVSPPELASLLKQTDAEEDDDKREALYAQAEPLTTQWFEICFDAPNPETGEPIQYHEALHGKTFTVRCLSEAEAVDAQFFCATVRADGTLITTTPKPPKY